MLVVGGLLVLAGLLVPGRLGPVYRAWMAGATAMSKVTTPIFMGVVYFLVLTPIGLVKQISTGRALRRVGAPSYWVHRPEGARRGDLERQF